MTIYLRALYWLPITIYRGFPVVLRRKVVGYIERHLPEIMQESENASLRIVREREKTRLRLERLAHKLDAFISEASPSPMN